MAIGRPSRLINAFGIIFFCLALPAFARQPNIILLVADDLGYGELGCQGNAEIPTPNIDSIAKIGARFTSAYVTAPLCSPSRAGMMTGRYQTRFGHEFNPTGKENLNPIIGLPLSEKTLASCLKEAGYATALVGKWHLGSVAKFHPMQRGFDEFFGFLHEGHYYAPPHTDNVTSYLRTNEPPYNEDNPLMRGTNIITEKEYLTDAFTREATGFIERQSKKPFFLYLAYNAVHSPMQAQKKYLDRFKNIPDLHRRVFAAMLANLDDSVGAVLDKVRELHLERDTLIFFISDNGGPTEELTSSNKPLRGGKGQLWEGGIREPFLMQWPGQFPAGIVFTNAVSSMDIFYTSIFAGQGKFPDDRVLDGVNLIPYLTGENLDPPHPVLFWRYGKNIALRKADWKLVRQSGPDFHLYNLATDISETKDLAAQKPEVVKELKSAMDELDKQMVAPAWKK